MFDAVFITNFTFMCFSLAVIPVKVIIFCVTVTVPETERQFALQCSHGQLPSLTPRTRIPICGHWSWGRGRGSRPSWGPPPPSPCRWSPGSRSEAGSGDQSPPRHTAQRYHHKYPEQSRWIHLIISSERTRSLVTLNHLITCDKL